MINYRPMQISDIPAGLTLCRHAGWNQIARDWEIFLQQKEDNSRVAYIQDQIVGTVTVMRYQDFFCWIGMVLVDPAYRKQGIGTKLLEEALQILQHEETVKLDATPAGREIYTKLDFIDEYPLSRMIATVKKKKLKPSLAIKITEKELPAVFAFDKDIFGADRGALLRWIWSGAAEYAFIVKENNAILGYCLGRNGHNYTQIGPVVANDMGIAQQLVSAALMSYEGKPIVMDVLHNNAKWLTWLASLGFTEQRPFVRMYRGSNRFPGITEKQFAGGGPEYG